MKELKDALVCTLLASIICAIVFAVFSARKYNEFAAKRYDMEAIKFGEWVYRQKEYRIAKEARERAEAEKREAMFDKRMEKQK